VAKQIVEKALEELQENIVLLDLGRNILNTLIIFMFIFLFATIFNFSVYYALIPAAIYFFVMIGFTFYQNKYLLVESNVPELKEQLRTVADNIYRTNPILDSLKEDVVKNMGKIRTSHFIDFNTITMRILLLTLLSIVVVIISFVNVKFDFALHGILPFVDLEKPGVRGAGQEVLNINLTYLEGDINSIFGQGSIAKLGTEELLLTINPLASDADINNIKKIKDKDFNPPNFPKEIYTSYDVAYNEKITKENQKVIKNYFEKITQVI